MFFHKNHPTPPHGQPRYKPMPDAHDVDVSQGVSEDIIRRTANALSYDIPLVAIKDTYWVGLSEYECWLAYCGARVVISSLSPNPT
jgi:hypothetical protein